MEIRKYQTRITLKIIAGIAAVGLLAVGIKYYKPVNPDNIEEFYPNPFLFDQFGGLEKELEIDVTGDEIKDEIMVFRYGHAFYADGKEQPDEFIGRKYYRIHAGTSEDKRLQQEYPVWLSDSQGW